MTEYSRSETETKDGKPVRLWRIHLWWRNRSVPVSDGCEYIKQRSLPAVA